MADLLPPEVSKWQFVEETARSVLETYGFREARVAGPGVAALAGAHAALAAKDPVARWYRVEPDRITGAVLGVSGPSVEAEVIALLEDVSREVGAHAYRISL